MDFIDPILADNKEDCLASSFATQAFAALDRLAELIPAAQDLGIISPVAGEMMECLQDLQAQLSLTTYDPEAITLRFRIEVVEVEPVEAEIIVTSGWRDQLARRLDVMVSEAITLLGKFQTWLRTDFLR